MSFYSICHCYFIALLTFYTLPLLQKKLACKFNDKIAILKGHHRVIHMVVHDIHAYTIHAFTFEAALNDVLNPFSQQIWVQAKFSLNSVKNVLFDKIQIREHYNLTTKEKKKKPFENKSKQKLTLFPFRTRVNRMKDYCNHHCAILAGTLERALNYILIPWNVLS